MKRSAVAFFLIAAACVGSRSPLKREELDSEMRQLRSLIAETELFREVLIAGHATRKFAAGHAEYLRESVAEHAKQLDSRGAAPGLERELARARQVSQQLQHALDVLAAQLK